jgi:hypothetical protein
VGDFNTLWVLIDGNTRTNSSGNGICVWKDYLLVFRDTAIDVYGNLTAVIGSRTWTNGWKTGLNNSSSHHAIWGLDDILYFCNGVSVGSIQEATPPFDPATGGTFNYATSALLLPSSYRSFRLEELGQNLMVAANIGTGGFTSTIFPWDRSSSSFFLPLRLPFQIDNFYVYDNILYIYSSKMMRIYATNGTSFNELKRLPPAAVLNDLSFNTAIGGVGVNLGRLLFTLYGRTGYAGLFSLNLNSGEYNRENALVFENIFSINSTTTSIFSFGMHVPRGAGNIFVAWYDSSLGYGGIDSYLGPNTSYLLYNNFESVIESPLIKVGTTLVQTVYSQIEIALANPLTASQSIRLSYRTNIIDPYTLIGTFDSTSIFSGNRSSINFINAPNNIEYFQVKCELKTTSTASPQLIEIRFRE